MSFPRIYADFHNLDDDNRLRLTCVGTQKDLARHGLHLHDGMVLTFYTDDADEQGRADELRIDGTVSYDAPTGAWVAQVDWGTLRHASEETTARPQPSAAPGQ